MRTLPSKAYDYIAETFGHETPALKFAREKTIELNKTFMSVSAVEGSLISFLLRLSGAKRVVEVGTLTGYSALWMAQALPKDGRLWTLEMDPRHIEAATEVFKNAGDSRITLVPGRAEENLEMLKKEAPFDAIFIDANKLAYPKYLDWAESNLKRGGLILADNTFCGGQVYGEPYDETFSEKQGRVMNEFNQRLADHNRYHSTLIPTVEGLTAAVMK